MSLGFHVILRLDDRRAFTTAPGAMRAVAAVVLAQGASRGLVAFRAADTHVHALLCAPRSDAGAFARYSALGLRARLGLDAPFARASILPLESQRHLEHAVDYVHRQAPHHGLALDPFEEGSSLADLLGLRATRTSEALRRRFVRTLPRRKPGPLVVPAPPRDLPFLAPLVPAGALADAAAAALLLPDLTGRSAEVVAARRAVAHLARGWPVRRLAAELGASVRSAFRMRTAPPDAALVQVVTRALAFRAARRAELDGQSPAHDARGA